MADRITAAVEQGIRMKDEVIELIQRGGDAESVCKLSRASKDLLHAQSLECIETGAQDVWGIHHASYQVLCAVVDTWFAAQKGGRNQ